MFPPSPSRPAQSLPMLSSGHHSSADVLNVQAPATCQALAKLVTGTAPCEAP